MLETGVIKFKTNAIFPRTKSEKTGYRIKIGNSNNLQLSTSILELNNFFENIKIPLKKKCNVRLKKIKRTTVTCLADPSPKA